MKRLIGVCLGLMILLAACGNKLDGTYKNSGMSIKADEDTETATMHIKMYESEGFLGMGKKDGNFDGEVNKDKKTMSFTSDEGDEMKFKYKVKGDKLILKDGSGSNSDKEIKLKKEK